MDWNELQSLTWPGYARKNGGKGIRNRVLVIYTVKCAEFVAQQIVAKSGSTNVELLGFDGCTDNQYAVNLLISFIRHPNVGAVLAVGLGCEYVQPEWLSKIAEEEGKPTSWMFIQNEGGTQPAVRKGVEWVQSALKELENTPLVEMSVKDLVIGAEWAGSTTGSPIRAARPSLRRSLRPLVWIICCSSALLLSRPQKSCAIPMIKRWNTAAACVSIRSAPATLQAACPPLKKRAWVL